MHPLILRPRALFYRTDCTRRSKFLTHALISNSMNNLFSYCGLVDTRISASEKDWPVRISAFEKDLPVRIAQRCMKIPMLQRNHSGYSRIFFPGKKRWRQWKQVSKRLREFVYFCSVYFPLSSPFVMSELPFFAITYRCKIGTSAYPFTKKVLLKKFIRTLVILLTKVVWAPMCFIFCPMSKSFSILILLFLCEICLF